MDEEIRFSGLLSAIRTNDQGQKEVLYDDMWVLASEAPLTELERIEVENS